MAGLPLQNSSPSEGRRSGAGDDIRANTEVLDIHLDSPGIQPRCMASGSIKGEESPDAEVGNFLYFCGAFLGGLAQLVERQHGMLKASGSNPLPSTGG